MTIGKISLQPAFRGLSFTTTLGRIYVLVDGRSLGRAVYPTLSSNWDDTAYCVASQGTADIFLPDLNGPSLRGTSWGNLNCDMNAYDRVALSGEGPITSGVGSYQATNLAAHTHPYGTQPGFSRSNGGGDGNCCYPVSQGSYATKGPDNITGLTASGDAVATAFEVPHMKLFPYICVNNG